MTNVLSYVSAHLAEPIRRDDLAQIAGLSPSRFSVVFRSIMGMPPMQYVQREKLQRALALLRNTDVTLDMIANDLGYCDAFQFSRQFKKGFHISPSHYRKALVDNGNLWMSA